MEDIMNVSISTINPILPRGTQVIYVPLHGKLGDDTNEYGFVWDDNGGRNVLVRYFRGSTDTLRTTSNSESTPRSLLVVTNTRDQDIVDRIIDNIEVEYEVR